MIKLPTVEVVLFVLDAHAAQKRHNGDPYFIHPIRALKILRGMLGVRSDLTDQAILIHDVEEDTSYDLAYLREMLGDPADLAHWLCKGATERLPGETKLEFNARCMIRLRAEGPPEALQLKIADRLDNLSDSRDWTQRFREFYIEDTWNLIQIFENVPHVQLLKKRWEQLRDGL